MKGKNVMYSARKNSESAFSVSSFSTCEQPPGKKLYTQKFLVVEDDRVSCIIVARLLRRAFPLAKCVFLSTEEQAYEKIEKYLDAIDAIFLDEDLGKQGRGINVARYVRNMVPVNTPVLISVSGSSLLSVEEKRKYDIVWMKPLPPIVDVKRQIERALNKRKQKHLKSMRAKPHTQPKETDTESEREGDGATENGR